MRSKSITLISILAVTLALLMPSLLLGGPALGATWTPVATNGMDGLYNLPQDMASASAVYGGSLYVGTEDIAWGRGCQVWRYDGGTNWTCVAGPGGSVGSGFGNVNNLSVTSMEAYSTCLYAGTFNPVSGCEVWEYDGANWSRVDPGSGFGVATTDMASAMAVYDDSGTASELYVGTNDTGGVGCEVYKYNGATWTAIVGGGGAVPPGPVLAGFSFPANTKVTSMVVYDDGSVVGVPTSSLWIGTANAAGCEVWQYNLNINWGPLGPAAPVDNLVGPAGTQAPNGLQGAWSLGDNAEAKLAVYDDGQFGVAPFDSLFIGTRDTIGAGGCELWQYNLNFAGGGPFATNVVPLVAPVASGSLYMDSGFGPPGIPNPSNDWLISMDVCLDGINAPLGMLYLGTQNTVNGCDVWSYGGPVIGAIVGVSAGGFGANINTSATSMGVTGAAPNQSLYVGTENATWIGGTGCEVWQSNLALASPARVDPGAVVAPLAGANGGFVINNNYDVSSSAYFKGYAYAGTGNMKVWSGVSNGCELWRSSDGTNWSKVVGYGAAVSGGFGDANNDTAFSMAVYNNKLYVGTANATTGTDIWSSSNGTSWNLEKNLGANNWITTSMLTYGSKLYVGTYNPTTGGELHAYDGSQWLQETVTGMGAANDAIASMGVLGQKLYIGTNNGAGCEVYSYGPSAGWAQETTGIAAANTRAASMETYGSKLYLGTSNGAGCEVHSFDGSSWNQENIGGAGFGDTNNIEASSMSRYNSKLFLGTQNPATGAEVHSFDGSSWSQENPDGFNDANNTEVSSLLATNPSLYAGVLNNSAGGSVQRTQAGVASIAINPNKGDRGQTLDVAITGTGTNFARGLSSATFGSGVTVNSTTVTDATHATANVTIAAGATGGTRDVSVQTGNENVTLNDGFTVEYPAPTVTSITPDSGTNDGTVSISNLSGTGFRNGAKVYLEGSSIQATNVNVSSATEITCDFDLSGAKAGKYDVKVENADGKSGTKADLFTVQDAPNTFYLAEGYTGTGFQEYLCIGNAGATNAEADITYMYPDGSTSQQTVTINANSRSTVDVNASIGADREVSVKVESGSDDLVVERPLYFDYQGKWKGGSDAVGAPSPDTKWFFAEGNTLSEFDQYVTVLNPGGTEANLTFRYQVEGEGETVCTDKVGANSRSTFKTRDQVGDGKNVSLLLESDQEVVAERPMYFDYQGLGAHGWTGGHCVMGVNSTHTEWYLAEGTTRGGFEEWLCIQNPNSNEITVDATYQLGEGQGEPIELSYDVPANERKTVSVNQEIGADKDVSVKLTSTCDFIAERPLYFNYHDWAPGGHDVMGVNDPAAAWFFAEGYTGANFEEWLCVQNPNDEDAEITITYYPESGTPIITNHEVLANSRQTVDVNADAGSDLMISAKVESTEPVIVERPMYFIFNCWPGGHDVAGYVPSD